MFNLEEYFKQIDLNFSHIKINLESLRAIVQQHLYHFKYENTFLYQEGKKPVALRQIPPFNLDSIFQQVVINRKAGFCFQNAELLAAVLSKCGFKVQKHLACVINLYKDAVVDSAISGSAHIVLIVSLENKNYLVEVGMAINNLREPLEIKAGEQNIGHDGYLLTNHETNWRLHVKLSQGYFCLHQFCSTPAKETEVQEMYDQLYTSLQKMPIRDDFLILGKVTEKKRKQLFWDNKSGFFKSFRADGSIKKHSILNSYEEVTALAKEKYDLILPPTL